MNYKKKQNYNNLIEKREDWKKKKKHKRIPVFSVKNKSSFLMRKNYTSRREEEIKIFLLRLVKLI